VPLLEQELPTLPEHLSSPPVFSGVRVTRSLVLYVCFVNRCLSFCIFFLWPLCGLFFDIRSLIAPLVSSNSFYSKWNCLFRFPYLGNKQVWRITTSIEGSYMLTVMRLHGKRHHHHPFSIAKADISSFLVNGWYNRNDDKQKNRIKFLYCHV
jgi:hypothetical protein